ncbi:hypothetical protein MMC31_002906 [Peltigera leucophlebia]|nr:hypothetical protein [Peltigera leucophlebia]
MATLSRIPRPTPHTTPRQAPGRSQLSKTFKIPSKTPITFNGITWLPAPPYLEDLEWTSIPTREPLMPEMKAKVRLELIKDYHALREEMFRENVKSFWMHERYPLTLANQGLTNLPYDATQLRLVCNKPTLLYWVHSALDKDSFQPFSFACIYTEWFRSHDNLPNLDFGHFFAGPVRILSTGPKSIGKIARGEANLVAGQPWPDPQSYKLLSTCRAIITVLDNFGADANADFDGYVRLGRESHRRSLLLVRTGDESHLSAPLSFEKIRAESLPLDRSEIISNDGIDAIRVSLATAVKFIADLQKREEAAFPIERDLLLADKSLCPSPTEQPRHKAFSADAYADNIMQQAEEKGIDKVSATWTAVRRIKAAELGVEIFDTHTTHRFQGRWK